MQENNTQNITILFWGRKKTQLPPSATLAKLLPLIVVPLAGLEAFFVDEVAVPEMFSDKAATCFATRSCSLREHTARL